jgi:hypothetical protein
MTKKMLAGAMIAAAVAIAAIPSSQAAQTNGVTSHALPAVATAQDRGTRMPMPAAVVAWGAGTQRSGR